MPTVSVAPLEKQIADLSSESERLSRVIEYQKAAAEESERNLRTNIEEKERILASRVSHMLHVLKWWLMFTVSDCH